MTEELDNDVKKLRFLDEDGELYPDWEEKKLNETATIISGATYGSGDTESEHTSKSVLPADNVDLNGNINIVREVFIKDSKSFSESKKLLPGDILTSTSSASRIHIGKVGIFTEDHLKSGYEYYAGGFMSIIRANEPSNIFIHNYLRSNQGRKWLDREMAGSAIQNISKQLKDWEINLPSLPEQTKISDFLSNLDERIEAQSKLIELLKKQKQGYSQRLFNGSLRFKKDDGTDYPDWEENKLWEVAELRSGKNKESSLDGKFLNVTMGSITAAGSLSVSYKTNLDGNLIKPNELVMPTRDIGKGYVIGITAVIPENEYKYQAGNCVYVLSAKSANPKFLSLTINNGRTRKAMQKRISGSAQLMIKIEDVTSLSINLPSLPEQEKIAAFLTNLDNRIDEEINKLEKLKLEKNGYMQRMLG